MSAKTKIEWTDRTWNPLRGCSRVSEGCRNCYAQSVAYRFSGAGLPYEGLAKKGADGKPVWTNKITLLGDKLTEPMHWKEPQRIFVNSMSDLFHPDVPFAFIDKVFAVMALCPQHTFQVLTKRPERMAEYLNDDDLNDRLGMALGNMLDGDWIWNAGKRFRPRIEKMIGAFLGEDENEPMVANPTPLKNLWVGTSVESQATADERIPDLVCCPAAIRFISYEPALIGVNFTCIGEWDCNVLHGWKPKVGEEYTNTGAVDWIIVGGESGKDARPFDVAWAYDTLNQCKQAGVPCFVKQFGAKAYYKKNPIVLKDKHGADWEEWPEVFNDLKVREFPNAQSL